MNEMQEINKFEFLPNEIFLECFDYLNWMYIYQSFDKLNNRLNNLIRNVPLHLNCQKMSTLLFYQFCRKIVVNPEMKNQIYSLHLSNKNASGQIARYLSRFSLGDFPHLQSLTLTGVSKGDVPKLKSMLPSISQLSSFYLIDSVHETDEIFASLPKSQLRILKISQLPHDSKYFYKLPSITNVTISNVHLSLLFQLLNDVPWLKYLNVQDIKTYRPNPLKKEIYTIPHYAKYLKKFICKDTLIEFRVIEMLLKEMPKLQSLIIDANSNDKTLIDAWKWEELITCSLPYLDIFKFKFECYLEHETNFIVEKFKEFQTDFWCKQHHWYNESSLSQHSCIIYTIPYISDTYALIPCTNINCNQFIKDSKKKFSSVTKLTIDSHLIKQKSQEYYFSSVITMKLDSHWTEEFIKSVNMMINLTNLKHLNMSSHCRLQTSSVLLELLKQTPSLSSIAINRHILRSLVADVELCEYLNRMIRKLQIIDHASDSLNHPYYLMRFCEIFSNIKQLTCKTKAPHCLVYLLQHLSKLEYLKLYSRTHSFGLQISALEEEARKLGLQIITNLSCIIPYVELSIRIIRH